MCGKQVTATSQLYLQFKYWNWVQIIPLRYQKQGKFVPVIVPVTLSDLDFPYLS